MARITSITPIADSGLSAELSSEIFDQIARFANYGFNKSHAAAYAAISFRTAYLKTHHPEAFFAAAVNMALDEVKDVAAFVGEMRDRQIPVWQPSVNRSRARFEPMRLKKTWKGRDYGICYGLSAIRGVGRAAAAAIEAERRSKGAFADIPSFISRMGEAVNRTALVALAKSGAFDGLAADRAQALAEVEGHRQRGSTAQLSMFEAMDAAPAVTVRDMSDDEVLDNEFDVLGHYMSGHPLAPLADRLVAENLYFSDFVLKGSTRGLRKASMPAIVTDTDVRRTNSGDLMAVILLSDPEGTYEALAFGDTFNAIRKSLRKKARLVFDMSVSIRGDERRLIVDGVRALDGDEVRAAA